MNMRPKCVVIIFFFTLLTISSFAQSSQSEMMADKFSRKLKDSLTLNESQRQDLYKISLDLNERKLTARHLYPTHLQDSIQISIQKIENSRDSLYKSVLPPDKFLLYTQKKRNLINNN